MTNRDDLSGYNLMGDATLEDDDDLTLKGTPLEELLRDAQRAAQAAARQAAARQAAATPHPGDEPDDLRPTRALPTVRARDQARDQARAQALASPAAGRREPVTLPVRLQPHATNPADQTITLPAHIDRDLLDATSLIPTQQDTAPPAADQTVTIPARIDRALLDATSQIPAKQPVDQTVTIPARAALERLAAPPANAAPSLATPPNHAPGALGLDPDATIEGPADLVPLLASHGGTHVLTHEDGWLEFIVEVDENKSLIVPIELARRGVLKPGMQLRVLARLMKS